MEWMGWMRIPMRRCKHGYRVVDPDHLAYLVRTHQPETAAMLAKEYPHPKCCPLTNDGAR